MRLVIGVMITVGVSIGSWFAFGNESPAPADTHCVVVGQPGMVCPHAELYKP